MLGGEIIVSGVAAVLLAISLLDRRVRDACQACQRGTRRLKHGEEQEPSSKYTSLKTLLKGNKRKVRFASKTVEYAPLPAPAPWRSRFYEPARQRFETIIVDGVYIRHSFSSSGHSIAEMHRGADKNDRMTLTEMGLAGAWAGVMNAPLRQVFERVKGVMQVRQGKGLQSPYSWSGACVADLVRREGVAMGLFRGMSATMLREPVQFAIYYPSYEIAKVYLLPSDRTSTIAPEAVLQVLAGGVAGCAMWLPPVYCLDVIKTRMQTAQDGVYRGVWDCLVKTVRAGGVPVLFRGFGASMLRAFPMHGLVFLGYETTIDLLGASPRHSSCPSATAEASLIKQPLE
eukprot:g11601.t1